MTICSVLANSKRDRSTAERLAAAQALLVELGFTPTRATIPLSLRAARLEISTQVHLNVHDYLAYHPQASPNWKDKAGLASSAKNRIQAREELRASLFPSKKALMEDLKKRKVNLNKVKASGLRDLLVGDAWRHW